MLHSISFLFVFRSQESSRGLDVLGPPSAGTSACATWSNCAETHCGKLPSTPILHVRFSSRVASTWPTAASVAETKRVWRRTHAFSVTHHDCSRVRASSLSPPPLPSCKPFPIPSLSPTLSSHSCSAPFPCVSAFASAPYPALGVCVFLCLSICLSVSLSLPLPLSLSVSLCVSLCLCLCLSLFVSLLPPSSPCLSHVFLLCLPTPVSRLHNRFGQVLAIVSRYVVKLHQGDIAAHQLHLQQQTTTATATATAPVSCLIIVVIAVVGCLLALGLGLGLGLG